MPVRRARRSTRPQWHGSAEPRLRVLSQLSSDWRATPPVGGSASASKLPKVGDERWRGGVRERPQTAQARIARGSSSSLVWDRARPRSAAPAHSTAAGMRGSAALHDKDAYLLRGQISLLLKKPQKAQQDFSKFIQLAQNDLAEMQKFQ